MAESDGFAPLPGISHGKSGRFMTCRSEGGRNMPLPQWSTDQRTGKQITCPFTFKVPWQKQAFNPCCAGG